MPLKYPDYQREFKFQVDGDGLPRAQVITLGQGRWLTVCPLCGCAHDVTSFRGDVYEPTCLLRITHPKVYQAWHEKYPDAASHTRVKLESRQLFEIIPFNAPVAKPKRRTHKKAA